MNLPGSTRVGHNVASDGLLRVGGRSGGVVDRSDDLVGHNDSDSKLWRARSSQSSPEKHEQRLKSTHLIGETEQAAKEFGEMHLTGAELSTSTEVGAVERSDRVDDEEGEPTAQQA